MPRSRASDGGGKRCHRNAHLRHGSCLYENIFGDYPCKAVLNACSTQTIASVAAEKNPSWRVSLEALLKSGFSTAAMALIGCVEIRGEGVCSHGKQYVSRKGCLTKITTLTNRKDGCAAHVGYKKGLQGSGGIMMQGGGLLFSKAAGTSTCEDWKMVGRKTVFSFQCARSVAERFGDHRQAASLQNEEV